MQDSLLLSSVAPENAKQVGATLSINPAHNWSSARAKPKTMSKASLYFVFSTAGLPVDNAKGTQRSDAMAGWLPDAWGSEMGFYSAKRLTDYR